MTDLAYPPEFLYYTVDALQCIIFIAGIVAGVLLLTRKRTIPGVVVTIAFAMLGLNLVYNLLSYFVLSDLFDNYSTVSWLNFCIGTPLFLLGLIGLVVFVFLDTKKKQNSPPLPDGGDTLLDL